MRLCRSIALVLIAGAIATGAQHVSAEGQTRRDRPTRVSPGQSARAAPARTDTLNYVPLDPASLKSYGSFAVARDSLEQVLRRAFATYADSATFRREWISFLYRDDVRLSHFQSGQPYWGMVPRDTQEFVPSLVMTLETTGNSNPLHTAIEQPLEDVGWGLEEVAYSADGPDGMQFALVCREAICVINAGWEFSEPENMTSVAYAHQSIRVTCVPRPASHPYRRRGAR